MDEPEHAGDKPAGPAIAKGLYYFLCWVAGPCAFGFVIAHFMIKYW